jgi:hypothetical protein
MAERPIARVYRGDVARAQALAMWRGLMKPAEAMAFVKITRLGKKVLSVAADPPPIPRKTVEVYVPVAVTMARVA